MVYVTHDQVEAMTMGDRICVMRDGNIMQIADPLTLYRQPENIFVAGFIGSPPMNLLKGKVQKLDGGLSFVEDAQQNALTIPLRGKLETLARFLRGQADYFRHPSRASQRPGQRSDPRPDQLGHRDIGTDGVEVNRLSSRQERVLSSPASPASITTSW